MITKTKRIDYKVTTASTSMSVKLSSKVLKL